mgnify:CR=1 FL=1
MSGENKKNLLTYLIFLSIAVTGIFYGNAIKQDYPQLRIWGFNNILIMLVGVPFVLLQSKAGVPDSRKGEMSGRDSLRYPVLIGAIFGILDVIVFKIILHPQPYDTLPPFVQPFPYSLFLYFSGAFEVEVFYRLIPLTAILFLGKVFMKGKYLKVFFIAGALLTSVREPLEQLPSAPSLLIVYSLTTGFLMNLIQALFFRKAGLISSLLLRLGHYMIWHILLGIYIEYIELPGINH